jgi:hypothetical protein
MHYCEIWCGIQEQNKCEKEYKTAYAHFVSYSPTMSRAIDRMPEPAEYREKKAIIIASSRFVACPNILFF